MSKVTAPVETHESTYFVQFSRTLTDRENAICTVIVYTLFKTMSVPSTLTVAEYNWKRSSEPVRKVSVESAPEKMVHACFDRGFDAIYDGEVI